MASKRDFKHWAVVLLGGISLASIGIFILEWDRSPQLEESDLSIDRDSPAPVPGYRRDTSSRQHPHVRNTAAVPAPRADVASSNLPPGSDPAREATRYEAAMALLERGETLKARRKWHEAGAIYEQIAREYPVIHDPDQEFIEVNMIEELAPEIAYFRCLREAPAVPTFDSIDSLARTIREHVAKNEIGRLERMLDRCGMLMGDGPEIDGMAEDPLETSRQIVGAIERNRGEMEWTEAEVSRFGIEVPSRTSDASYYFVFQANDDRWTWTGFRKIRAGGANRSAASVR